MKKTKLSVNINKIATLRNARGGDIPNLCHFAKLVLETKAGGLTLHPRPDQRHIRYQDVWDIKKYMKKYPNKEWNIEGYPSQKFLSLLTAVKPHQCTLVPDPPHVLTSNAGWDFYKNKNLLQKVGQKLKQKNIRVSLFLDPLKMSPKQYQALKELAPDRVEFYTESYAKNYHHTKKRKLVLNTYQKVAQKVQKMGIAINAGHDLNQENLLLLLTSLPQIQEVSIGQALIAEALEQGLVKGIRSYLKIIQKAYRQEG